MSMPEYAEKYGVFYSPGMAVDAISCPPKAGVTGSNPVERANKTTPKLSLREAAELNAYRRTESVRSGGVH
jgi:hypothetical protein